MKGLISCCLIFFMVNCSSKQGKQNLSNTSNSALSSDKSSPAEASVVMPKDTLQFDFGSIVSGSITCVSGKDVFLMEDSLMKNKSKTCLQLGDEIRVDKYIKSDIVGHWARPVYYVTVKKDGKEVKGYIGQENVAVCRKKLSDGNFFLLVLTGTKMNNDYPYLCGKAVIVNAENLSLYEKEVELIGGESNDDRILYYGYSIQASINSSEGLSGVVNVIDINMHYPACGYTNGNMFLLWDGQKIHNAFTNFGMSEAGLFANYSEAIFPANPDGKNGKILSVSNHVEYNDGSQDIIEISHDSLVVQYGWVEGKGVILEDTIFDGSQINPK